MRSDPRFRLVLYAWVPFQMLLLFWGAVVISTGSWAPFELVGIVWSMGLCTGAIGITAAHELIHSARPAERFLGRTLLATVSYLHFDVEHIEGHHRRVATPEDPASARPGESIFAFLPRTIVGSFKSAWRFERARGLPLWDVRNRMLWAIVLPATMALGFYFFFGPLAVAYFALQSVVAIGLVEVVNYVEHYGLERESLGEGNWAPVALAHSWDADYPLSNALLFGLQRHADHHLHPRRPYQTLRASSESPELPTGYAGMIWLAVIPPLWRRVMDRRLYASRRSTSTRVSEKVGARPRSA